MGIIMNGSKIIRVNVFASSNLEDVRNAVFDLLMQLNRTFRSRGIEFALSTSSYDSKDEEIDIALYWLDFGDLPKEKFESAYESLKAGGNPSKIYVFFRESKDACEEAMQTFKDSFASKYGHFYCHFEHVDSVKFELTVRCLEYLPNQLMLNRKENLLNIQENGEIYFAGKVIASIENLPFAKLNQKRKILIQDIFNAEEKVEQLESYYKESPDNSDLEEALRNARINLAHLKDEKMKYDETLFSRALFFIKESGKEMDERVVKARALFERGRMSDANKVLDINEIKEKDENDAKLFEEAKQVRVKNIQAFTAKAEIVMLDETLNIKERFQQSCTAYKEAIRIANEINYEDDNLVEILFNYALLLSDFKHYTEAIYILKEVLTINRKLYNINPEKYDINLAMTLNNLAYLYRELNNHDSAKIASSEALSMLRTLREKNTGFDLEIATCLCNIANIEKDLNNYNESEINFKEAISIYRKLANDNPKEYARTLADFLNNLACLHCDQKRFVEAEKECKEALSICLKLNNQSQTRIDFKLAIFLCSLVWIYYCLAMIYFSQKKYDIAEHENIESLLIIRRLADYNPDAYEEILVKVLNNLAIIHLCQAKFDNAEKELTEVLIICKRLSEYNPDLYYKDLAMAFNNLSSIHENQNKFDEAENDQKNALSIQKKLFQISPDVYAKDLARSFNNLAIFHQKQGKLDEAENDQKESIAIYHKLFKISPDVYAEDLARSFLNLASIHQNQEKLFEAEIELKNSLSIYQKLFKINPNVYAKDVVRVLHNLAFFHHSKGKLDNAETEFSNALSVYIKMSELTPGVYDENIAECLLFLASYHQFLSKYDEAEKEYTKSLCIYERISENNHNLYGDIILKLKRKLVELRNERNG